MPPPANSACVTLRFMCYELQARERIRQQNGVVAAVSGAGSPNVSGTGSYQKSAAPVDRTAIGQAPVFLTAGRMARLLSRAKATDVGKIEQVGDGRRWLRHRRRGGREQQGGCEMPGGCRLLLIARWTEPHVGAPTECPQAF